MSIQNVNGMDEIEQVSYELARQARHHFEAWRSGKFYIPRPALRAMGRRYLWLRSQPSLIMLELCEFGRLYAFFALVYAPFGELQDQSQLAIDFCNLVNHSPTLLKDGQTGYNLLVKTDFAD